MPQSSPYYPKKDLTYGQLYHFIKQKTFNFNPFDKTSILEGKQLILREARDVSPNYKMFIKAAKLATNLSERTIKTLLYKEEKCYTEVLSQGVSYTTGVPAMIGAKLMLEEKWQEKGVYNMEEFDPDPFMEELMVQGLPWKVMES